MATCLFCDHGNHDKCDGTVLVVDQDGSSKCVCQCYHLYKDREAQRIKDAERAIQRFIQRLNVGHVYTVILRTELEELQKRLPKTTKFKVGFVDSEDRQHVHLEEFVDNKLISATFDTSECPTCGVNNGTDGTPEGGDQPTR